MRTTLALDDDIFSYARAHAQSQRRSIGEVVSALVRAGIRAQDAPRKKAIAPKSKYALLPARAELITSEHVRALMDQEGI